MSDIAIKPRTKVRLKPERPRLHKVILLNDDYTPREFVVLVLKAVFRMNADQAYRVMMTAHRRGACVIAVYTRDVAETKAKEATELGDQLEQYRRLAAIGHRRRALVQHAQLAKPQGDRVLLGGAGLVDRDRRGGHRAEDQNAHHQDHHGITP